MGLSGLSSAFAPKFSPSMINHDKKGDLGRAVIGGLGEGCIRSKLQFPHQVIRDTQ